MISLVSTWPLKDGCPEALQKALENLAPLVKENEPGTLMYLVNLEAKSPLNSNLQPASPPPLPIPLDQQKAVIFIEMYKDAEAFSQHISGSVFTAFRADNNNYFIADAPMTSTFRADTSFLARQSGFVREEALNIINAD